MPENMEKSKEPQQEAGSHKAIDWVQGIKASTKAEYKGFITGMMNSCFGCPENIASLINKAVQVVLQHNPNKEGEVDAGGSDGSIHIYLNVAEHSDQLFKYLLLESEQQSDNISANALKLAERLVVMENEVGGVCQNGYYILHKVIEVSKCGLGEAVDVLLQRKVNQQVCDKIGFYPIHYVVNRMRTNSSDTELFSVLESLVDQNIDVNVQNKNRSTPLHYLACGGHDDIIKAVQMMLEKGADPNAKDSEGFLPIHYACGRQLNGNTGHISHQHLGILQCLVDKHSKVNEKGGAAELTPLHCCLFAFGQVREAVELLLKCRADPNIPNRHNLCPIHLVCAGMIGNNSPLNFGNMALELLERQYDAFFSGNIENASVPLDPSRHQGNDCIVDTTLLDVLLKHGAKVNVAGPNGHTPLHMTLVLPGNKLPAIKILLQNKADVNAVDNLGGCPIHYLCGVNAMGVITKLTNWDENYIDMFVKHHLNINGQTKETELTGIHIAMVHSGAFANKCIEQLLKCKANPNMPDGAGVYPIHLACGLRTFGKDSQKITISVDSHRVQSLEMLVNYKADLDVKWQAKCAPLHLLLSGKTTGKIVMRATRLLLENGADPNQQDEEGQFPIHLVCNAQFTENIEGVNMREQAPVGLPFVGPNGVLHYPTVVSNRNSEESDNTGLDVDQIEDLMKMLIHYKANVDAVEGKEKQTALHKAIVMRLPPKVISVLLKHKATVNKADGQGIYPIHYTFDLHGTGASELDYMSAHKDNPERPHNAFAHAERDKHMPKMPRKNVSHPLGPYLPTPTIFTETYGPVLQQGSGIYNQWNYSDDLRQRQRHIVNVLELLLTHDADVNVTQEIPKETKAEFQPALDLRKRGVLHLAVLQLNSSPDIIKKILDSRADPNLQDADGMSPLHYACKRSVHFPMTRPENVCEIVCAILERGASVNLNDKAHNMPLHYAMQCGVPKIIEILLAKGAQRDKRNIKGLKPEQLVSDTSEEFKIIKEHEASHADLMQNQELAPECSNCADPKEKALYKVFLFVSSRVKADEWKPLLRRLDPFDDMEETEAFISDLMNQQESLQEKIYLGLRKWKRNLGQEASFEELLTALHDLNMVNLVEKVAERYKTSFPTVDTQQ